MFGLEGVQGRHNGIITTQGNVSASNDPKQVPNDATEVLLKGAAKAAAGRELGLSEEETLAATSRAYRRQQQREAYASRNERLAQWEQKQKTLQDEGFQVNAPDTDLEGDDELTAVFGEYDDESGFRDMAKEDGIDDRPPEYEQKGTRTYKRTGAQYPIGNRVRPEEGDFFRAEVAPVSVMRDALARLQGATVTGSTDARARLERQVQGGADLELQKHLAQKMVESDAARVDPEMRQYNEFQAEAESQRIARDYFGGYGSGSMADDNIGRIAEIRKLGGAGSLALAESAQEVRYSQGGDLGPAIVRDGVFFDPRTNDPIAIQGPEVPPQFRGANTPNTAQTNNAPQAQNAATWMQDNLPTPKEGGRVYGDYPQTDITLATTNVAQKLRELKGYGLENFTPNVRSADELQRVVDYVVKKSAEKGKPLYLKDEKGVNRPSANPGVPEVLQLLQMSGPEKTDLANALYQIEMSQPSAARETYQTRQSGPTPGVTFDSTEAIEGNLAQTLDLAKIPAGSTIEGPGGKRLGIRAELQKLDTPAAQKPIIGQVQGEKMRVNRMKPKNMGSGDQLAADITAQAQERAKGKPINEERNQQNIIKARLTEERESRDNRKRADVMSEIISRLPPNARVRRMP